VDNITSNFWDVLLWSFWISIFIGAFTFWVLAFFDVFADSTVGGWAKAGWTALLIFVPWLGALIYWIVRDQSKRKLAASIRAS
jgi:hypothetical protein